MHKRNPFAATPLALALASGALLGAQETTLSAVEVRGKKEKAQVVTQYRADSAQTGGLGERSLLETPFSLEVVPAALLENQQASTIAEAFRGDAAVTPISNGYVGEASGIAIRGLQLDLLNGYKVDGLSVPNWGSDLPLEHFSQVQLLKGLSGFLYGFGSPGGVANYVLKRPEGRVATAEVGYLSDGVLKLHGDLGARLGAKDQVGLRANAVHEEGDTYVDGGHIQRDSVSLAADVRLGADLLLSVDGLYQKRRVDGSYYGIIPAQDFGLPVEEPVRIPEPLDGSQRVAQPYTFYETAYRIFGAELLWAASSAWDLKFSYRASEQDRLNRDSAILLLDNAGTYSETQYNSFGHYGYENLQALATGRLKTGAVSHVVALGASHQTGDQHYPKGWSSASLGTGNIHQVGDFPDPGLVLDKATYRYATIDETSFFASDTLSFGGAWSLLAGLRRISYRQDVLNLDGALANRYERTAATPTVALIYKAGPGTTLYGSYVEGLEQGGTAPMTALNANEVFGPLKSRQFEAGLKTEGSNWGAHAALFRIERGLEYLNATNVYVQGGQALHQGLDLGARVGLGAWTLLGSALLQDAKNADAAAEVDGKRTAGSSRFQSSLYLEYALQRIEGLVLTGGVQHVGDRPLEAGNQNVARAYTLASLGARYGFRWGGRESTLRLNLDNVTNERYWLTSWGFILNQGAPRTVRASFQHRF